MVSALKNPKRQKARTENPVNMKAKGFLPAIRPSLNDKLFSIVFKIFRSFIYYSLSGFNKNNYLIKHIVFSFVIILSVRLVSDIEL